MTAKVKFQVSDGTETITVSMDVIVHRPPLGCTVMVRVLLRLYRRVCPVGSVHMPYEIKPPASGNTVLVPFSAFPSFSKYRVHDADDIPHFQNPVTVGGAPLYISRPSN